MACSTLMMFDINDILRCDKTISRHVVTFADAEREKLKELLSIPLQQHSLTICPDFWTDPYRKISYLGITIIMVDDKCSFNSIDLFCKPFAYKTKSAENVVSSLLNCLNFLGIDSLSDVNIVCDRGKQKKHLKKSDSINTIDTSQPALLKVEDDNHNETQESSTEDSEVSTDNDCDDDMTLLVAKKTKKPIKKSTSSKNDSLAQIKITMDQIPSSAKHVLRTLNKCKKIVKYVKQAGINNDIKEKDGITLHQSCIVRWLSMSNLLESISTSFKATKRLLLSRNQYSLVSDLDLPTIKQLVLVLKSLKHVTSLVQTGNSPSLQMVLLCNLSLKHALSSHQSLLDYVNKHCNSKSNTLHNNEIEENEDYELEGIKWFRERFLILIDEIFCLDVRHYCATLLNPKYKLLKFCTKGERTRCHEYIRQQLKILTDVGTTAKSYKTPSEPQQKVFKTADTIFACFEDDYSNDEVQNDLQDSPYESDEYEFNAVQFDELDRYLILNTVKPPYSGHLSDFPKVSTIQRCPL
ncbi:unnamed protein product [Rotaria magnacalcarata]|uniref:Uncharacterized protein n=1 Tax=Rotaria magnacalcarata TaxID=392030 RepID=A0A820DQ52_9BILA|nr:unnamed protein product [Rotaria magnacalcarata]